MIHKPSVVAVANIIRNFRGIVIYKTHSYNIYFPQHVHSITQHLLIINKTEPKKN